jgi:hypothetical protein
MGSAHEPNFAWKKPCGCQRGDWGGERATDHPLNRLLGFCGWCGTRCLGGSLGERQRRLGWPTSASHTRVGACVGRASTQDPDEPFFRFFRQMWFWLPPGAGLGPRGWPGRKTFRPYGLRPSVARPPAFLGVRVDAWDFHTRVNADSCLRRNDAPACEGRNGPPNAEFCVGDPNVTPAQAGAEQLRRSGGENFCGIFGFCITYEHRQASIIQARPPATAIAGRHQAARPWLASKEDRRQIREQGRKEHRRRKKDEDAGDLRSFLFLRPFAFLAAVLLVLFVTIKSRSGRR